VNERSRCAMAGRPAPGIMGFVLLSETPFLGEDLLPLLVLALGGALLVGNVMALARPPARPKDGELRRAPTGRSLVMAFIGLIAAIWALGSLLS
jgi:hypothetical protein